MSRTLENLKISSEFHPFLKNLSELAERKERMPFIGREKEIEMVMESLLRKLKNNLLLIGKPGVGKTALITEIASRINRGKVPRSLEQKTILELSMNTFLYSRESVECLIKDFEKLFSEVLGNRDKIIFFLDEMQLQSIIGMDKADEFRQIQTLLKSYLANRELNVIAATTPENYYKFIKHDEVLSLSFSPVFINEPNEKEMLTILKGLKPYFEHYYALRIEEYIFEKIYLLARNFIPHRAFPHKAIDLLDMSCSKSSLKGKGKLGENFLFQSVSDISKLRLGIVKLDPYKHSRGIHDYLKKHVINQQAALSEISRIIKLFRLEKEKNDNRPEGIFLFLGATGVGKSYIALRIAEYLFGSESKLRIIDLDDYRTPAGIRKLIGDSQSAAGTLIREIEDHPFSVILFENIDDAHFQVLDFLGKVLGKGYVVDAFGKKYFLSNIIFILNLTQIGSAETVTPIGFFPGNSTSGKLVIPNKIMNVLDWVDEIIEFVPLSEKDLKAIAREKADSLKKEINKNFRLKIIIDESVLDIIAARALNDGRFAHSVSRIIEREIRIKLMDIITRSDSHKTIRVGLRSRKIVISPQGKSRDH
jgi:ATP-dependent Clp protease ATP-binding subunit ClpC